MRHIYSYRNPLTSVHIYQYLPIINDHQCKYFKLA